MPPVLNNNNESANVSFLQNFRIKYLNLYFIPVKLEVNWHHSNSVGTDVKNAASLIRVRYCQSQADEIVSYVCLLLNVRSCSLCPHRCLLPRIEIKLFKILQIWMIDQESSCSINFMVVSLWKPAIWKLINFLITFLGIWKNIWYG